MEHCEACVKAARLEERVKSLEGTNMAQWEKIENLADAISKGKNWLVGLFVTLSLNLIGIIVLLAKAP